MIEGACLQQADATERAPEVELLIFIRECNVMCVVVVPECCNVSEFHDVLVRTVDAAAARAVGCGLPMMTSSVFYFAVEGVRTRLRINTYVSTYLRIFSSLVLSGGHEHSVFVLAVRTSMMCACAVHK